MDISNKTLAAFLLAAMIVSIGGTILSLQKLNSISSTGMATTDSGDLDINIQNLLSITTEDNNAIDFGNCLPASGQTILVNSENTENTSTSCSLNASVEGFYVRNNGNVDASVNITPSDVGTADGGTFFSSTTQSRIFYKTTDAGNGTYTGGCQTGLQGTYTALTTAGSPVLGCSNLTAESTANSFQADIQIQLPSNAVGSENVVFTFDAEAAS